MKKLNKKLAKRLRVKRGIRSKISGSADRPRLSIFRSNANIYAQLIDDATGNTLVAASSLEKDVESGKPVEVGTRVGETLAKRALEKGINNVVFDRNGFKYHGRVKALAEGSRKGGLSF